MSEGSARELWRVKRNRYSNVQIAVHTFDSLLAAHVTFVNQKERVIGAPSADLAGSIASAASREITNGYHKPMPVFIPRCLPSIMLAHGVSIIHSFNHVLTSPKKIL